MSKKTRTEAFPTHNDSTELLAGLEEKRKCLTWFDYTSFHEWDPMLDEKLMESITRKQLKEFLENWERYDTCPPTYWKSVKKNGKEDFKQSVIQTIEEYIKDNFYKPIHTKPDYKLPKEEEK